MNNTNPPHPMASFNPHTQELYTKPFQLSELSVCPVDLVQHGIVFGSTGKGKTRYFLIPIVEKLVSQFGKDLGKKAAACVIDAKADMEGFVGDICQRTGRQEDLRVLKEDGNCWFDLFSQFDGNASAVANFLYDLVEDGKSGNGTNEVFWDENVRRLLKMAAVVAVASHGPDFGGLRGIKTSLARLTDIRAETGDSDEDDEAPESLKQIQQIMQEGVVQQWIHGETAQSVLDYCKKDIQRNSDRTWGVISNYARNFTEYFSDDRLVGLFEPQPDKERIIPERVIDEGLIFVVSLSPLLYKGLEKPFLKSIKQSFCHRILERNQLCNYTETPPSQINQERPILFVMDEFHTSLTPDGSQNEAFFLDRAREFRCICLLATQGVSAIRARMGNYAAVDHLLNNTRMQVFFGTCCPETLSYFERIVGWEPRLEESEGLERTPAPPRFRLPNHEFASCSPWKKTTRQTNIQRQPLIDAASLRRLPVGEAIVVGLGPEPKRVCFKIGV